MMARKESLLSTEPTRDAVPSELERVLSEAQGTAVRLASISRQSSAYRTSYSLEEIDAVLDDGSRLALVLKDVSPRALTEQARRVKPACLCNPWREIETYRGILMPSGLSTPHCYGVSVEPAADRYWLFLERVPGIELYQADGPSLWEQAARWLARFHARFASPDARAAARERAPLLEYDQSFYRQWPRRALAFAEAWPLDMQRQIAWLTDRYEPVVERLVSMPTTVLHGEFYASNVLVHQTVGTPRVCPVDWEMAAVGPGLIDLAALVAGAWAEPERLRVARAYHDAQGESGGDRRSFDDLLVDLKFCRLHLAIQWLGWAKDWTPPTENAHDWLSDAMSLAQELFDDESPMRGRNVPV